MYNSPEISVIIPVFNEEECLPILFYRLMTVLESLGKSYEVIFVNDGSTDKTGQILDRFHEDHPEKVTFIDFNGNYGQFTAICAGFERMRGLVAVTLDADLQNPPEEIPKLLQKMEEGYDYVGGIRIKRKDSLMRHWCSRLNNKLREMTTRIKLTDQGCMLRAYSRTIAKAVAQSQEKSVFVSALAYKYASNPAEVLVAHEERGGGKSRYNYFGLVRLNFDLLTGFTLVPLQALTWIGFISCIVSLSLMGMISGSVLLFDTVVNPLQVILLGIGVAGGIMLTGLGLVGEYVGRIYQTVLQRPNYLIKRVVQPGEEENSQIRAAE